MDIEYIKRFIAVGQYLNFSKAAETLFISQPTLSHSIVSLEKKLGTPLLVRNTKSVKLTRAGELFLPTAIQIVSLYQNAVDDISQELDLGSGVLNIGYLGQVMNNKFSIWLKMFRKAWPDTKVNILHNSTAAMLEAFENRTIHLGILYHMNAVNIPDLRYQEMDREKFKLLVSATHPLARQEKVDLAALADEPFLICDRTSSPHYYDRILDICERRGLKPNISQSVKLVGDIYRLVGVGLGVAIMSHSAARSYDGFNVKFIDIDDGEDLINNVVIAWMDDLSPLARRFKDIAKKDMSM